MDNLFWPLCIPILVTTKWSIKIHPHGTKDPIVIDCYQPHCGVMPNDQTAGDGLLQPHLAADNTVNRLVWQRKHLQNARMTILG